MSDNPLAEWLQERQNALRGSPDDDEGSTDAEARSWPAGSAGTKDARGARWVRPFDEVDGGRTGRRRVVLLLAVIPWVLTGVLAAAVLDRPGSPADAEQPPPVAAPPGQAVDDQVVGAVAALAVRTARTTAGTGASGDGRRYVDLVVPEAVRREGDVAVVTLVAVVLEGSADRWHTARPARFAVPVGVTDGRPVALDQPWPLPVAPAPEAPVAWEPATADRDGVAAAITAAGYADVEVLHLDASADVPGLLRASVRARAPGETVANDHRVWLRDQPELAVLGVHARPS